MMTTTIDRVLAGLGIIGLLWLASVADSKPMPTGKTGTSLGVLAQIEPGAHGGWRSQGQEGRA